MGLGNGSIHVTIAGVSELQFSETSSVAREIHMMYLHVSELKLVAKTNHINVCSITQMGLRDFLYVDEIFVIVSNV